MTRSSFVAQHWLAVALTLACAALPALALEQRTIYPGSFTQIQVCAPIYVKVVPDTGLDPNSTYSVVVEGSKVVSTAIRAPVDNSTGTLKIMSKRDYSTKQPIKVTVFLPAAELAGVSFSGLAGLAIAPGFSPPSLTVEAGSGTGSIAVGSINTTSLTINTLGAGTIEVNGTITSANVTIGSTGSVYLNGVSQLVTVNASAGLGSLTVNATSSALQINGAMNSVGSVSYNEGQCLVVGPPGATTQPCQQTTVLEFPALNPQWTCGQKAVGMFNCEYGTRTANSQECSLDELTLGML